jgi:hypothetical protein
MDSIFIATPAFLGLVDNHYAISLAETTTLLKEKRISFRLQINATKSSLALARNELLDAFLKSDCSHILCIDADLGWEPEAVLSLLSSNKDFVGGCYPTRDLTAFLFNAAYDSQSFYIFDGKLMEMKTIPAGFMLIKRHVLEKMISDHPELAYAISERTPTPGHCLFNTEIVNDGLCGEDFVFCKRAQESGFRIWVDPTLLFKHGKAVGRLQGCLRPEHLKKHH